MTHELIDIGANLTHDSFDDDRDDMMQRAHDAGVTRMIVTGSSNQGSLDALNLAESEPGRLFATAGVHPHHAADFDASSVKLITELCDSWVNDSVPPDAYVLLVGDARAYYVQCRVDYCVVFNRNPFAEAISAAGGDAAQVIAWLRGRGYTHVAVQWTEVDRLGKTYGFWPEIDRALFERLTAAGLRIVDERRNEPGERPWATVYEVPAE